MRPFSPNRRLSAGKLLTAVLAVTWPWCLCAEEIDIRRHWDISTAYNENTSTRKKVCLNGFWQFSLVQGEAVQPAGKWKYLKVPGGFKRCYNLYREDGKLASYKAQKEMPEGGLGLYRRTFRLERSLERKRLFLDFEAIMDSGVVYLNGRKVGELRPNPNIGQGRLDITGAARFGAENELRVLVAARPKVAAWKRQAGIAADVWLVAEPKGPHIEKHFIHSSVRNKMLHVELDVVGENVDGKSFSLAVEVRDAGGRNRVFSLPRRRLSAGARAKLAFDLAPHWRKIQLWNHDIPRLYRVHLRLKGGRTLDEVVERVGFCETWVEGKNMMWNGRPLHRRGTYRLDEKNIKDGRQDGYLDRRCLYDFLRLYKKAGYNSLTVEYAYGPQLENLLRACDEMGVYVWVNCLDRYRQSMFKNKPPVDELLAQLPPVVERFRNHACVGVWGSWFSGGFGTDENTRVPQTWMANFKPVMHSTDRHFEFCERTGDVIRTADKTRPVCFYLGEQVGDAITAFLYPCFGTPVQEVESWPLKWRREEPGKPFWVVESTINYYATWYDMTEARSKGSKADNHVYKNAARHFGPKAYFMGPDDDPAPFVMEGCLPTKGDTSVGKVIMHDRLPSAFLETQLMMSRRVFRAWRTFGFATIHAGDELQNCFHDFRGVSPEIGVHDKYHLPHAELKKPGPVCDWYYWNERFINLVEPELPKVAPASSIHDRFRDGAWGPFLAFIAHKGEAFADFTHKDHGYVAGETIAKQVVLINDHADTRIVRVTVMFAGKGEKGGAVALSKGLELESGEIRFVPFEVKAPPVRKREEFLLRLEARIEPGEIAKIADNPGGDVNDSFPEALRDSFTIEVFPKTAARINLRVDNLRVGLYDEVGRTHKAMDRLGVKWADLAKATDLSRARGDELGLLRKAGRKRPLAHPTTGWRSRSAPMETELRALVREAVEGGKRLSAYVSIAGKKVRGRAIAAGEAGLTVRAVGVERAVSWEELGDAELLRLARKCVGKDDVEKLKLLARFAREKKLEEAAELVEELNALGAAEELPSREKTPRPAVRKAPAPRLSRPAARGVNLVVVGRESLTHAFHELATQLKLAEKIEAGEADLLVFEQTAESAPSIARDLDDLSIRDTFILDTEHPIFMLAGLKEADLRNWRGLADLIPSMPEDYFYYKPGTRRFPKWTNEGVVTSYVLRKPEYGNFRPLVEADFDLWGTPLLEVMSGRGVAIFCQMDLTGREDPAAQRLLAAIFTYLNMRARGKKADPFKPAYFLGGEIGRNIVERRGILAKRFDANSAAPGTLVIAGGRKDSLLPRAGAIKSFVERGGDALYLVDSPENFAARLVPGGVKAEKSEAFRFKLAGDSDVTRAVGQGDLVYASPPGFPVFSGAGRALTEPGAIFEVKHGRGRFVLCPLVAPDKYDGEWAAAKIERLYSTVLTNLGVRQAAPDFDFPAEKPISDPTPGRVYWSFDEDMGKWKGGRVTAERSYRGGKCAELEPYGSKDDQVWNRGYVAVENKKGIVKLGKDPWFCFAGYAEGSPFFIITVRTNKKRFEFEYRMAANKWVPLSMPLSSFFGAPKDLEGQTIDYLRVRWGGVADTKTHTRTFVDEIYIGPGPKTIFRRHPCPPSYDPNVYVTW